MTKKEIKGYITNGAAVDITNIPLEKGGKIMNGKVTTYKDQCGVMHWDYQPYYSESENVG